MRVFPKVKGGTQIVKLIAARYKDLFSAEAKASFIWLLGEYCKRIDNAGHILEHFTKTYFTQPHEVQLRILSTGIKMYLFQIEPIDSVMSELIQSISDKCTNPDLRDRGYIYWRLLYKDDEKAKEIIFNEPQAVEVDTKFSKEIIEEAKRNLKLGGKISGILNRKPEELFKGKESVVRAPNVELDSEVIVKSDAQPTPQQAEQPAAQADDFDILDSVPVTPVDNAVKSLPKVQATPAPLPVAQPKSKIGAPPGQSSPTQKKMEFDLLDFDGAGGSTPANAPQPSSSKKPQQMEENLFEDEVDNNQQEEDLFEGVEDTIEDYKFLSMPEEVN